MKQRKEELNQIYKDYQKQTKQDSGFIEKLWSLSKVIETYDKEYDQEMAQIEMATYIHDRLSKDLS